MPATLLPAQVPVKVVEVHCDCVSKLAQAVNFVPSRTHTFAPVKVFSHTAVPLHSAVVQSGKQVFEKQSALAGQSALVVHGRLQAPIRH